MCEAHHKKARCSHTRCLMFSGVCIFPVAVTLAIWKVCLCNMSQIQESFCPLLYCLLVSVLKDTWARLKHNKLLFYIFAYKINYFLTKKERKSNFSMVFYSFYRVERRKKSIKSHGYVRKIPFVKYNFPARWGFSASVNIYFAF